MTINIILLANYLVKIIYLSLLFDVWRLPCDWLTFSLPTYGHTDTTDTTDRIHTLSYRPARASLLCRLLQLVSSFIITIIYYPLDVLLNLPNDIYLVYPEPLFRLLFIILTLCLHLITGLATGNYFHVDLFVCIQSREEM